MTISPSTQFEFCSNTIWPSENGDKYEQAVMEGVLDELLTGFLNGVCLNVKVCLDDIEWHQVDSKPRAYRMAAREAIKAFIEDRSNWERK